MSDVRGAAAVGQPGVNSVAPPEKPAQSWGWVGEEQWWKQFEYLHDNQVSSAAF